MARTGPEDEKGGDGRRLNPAFAITTDVLTHVQWEVPTLVAADFPGVTPHTLRELNAALPQGSRRTIVALTVKAEDEQAVELQTNGDSSEKKIVLRLGKEATRIMEDRERTRLSTTALAADREPTLPLSLGASKRIENVDVLITLIKTRVSSNQHRMDLLFQLLKSDLKQAVLTWAAAQGPGTECYAATIRVKGLFPHWAQALRLIHNTAEIEHARVDKLYERLQHLLEPHRAMNFSPIEKYLDAVQAALAQVSSEQALTRRHRESSWANSRAFAEKAILNRKGEMYPTLQHAHIAMHISRKHDVLLRDEARRLATNRDASNYNRGDPNPPQGFPTLEQLLKVCYSELTPSRQKDLENQRAVLTFGSSTKPPPKVTPPDAGTPPNKRRDRSRRGSSGRYAARVKAAALDCNISEDAAKAYLENFNVAGLELAKSDTVRCYLCHEQGHMARECPKKVDGVPFKKAADCFRCSHPQFKVLEADRNHPFHKCPHRPARCKSADGAKSVWCFQCQGEHTLRECPKLDDTKRKAWMDILRPIRDGKKKSRADYKVIAAFQIKRGSLGIRVVKGDDSKIPKGAAREAIINQFDPHFDEVNEETTAPGTGNGGDLGTSTDATAPSESETDEE